MCEAKQRIAFLFIWLHSHDFTSGQAASHHIASHHRRSNRASYYTHIKAHSHHVVVIISYLARIVSHRLTSDSHRKTSQTLITSYRIVSHRITSTAPHPTTRPSDRMLALSPPHVVDKLIQARTSSSEIVTRLADRQPCDLVVVGGHLSESLFCIEEESLQLLGHAKQNEQCRKESVWSRRNGSDRIEHRLKEGCDRAASSSN